MVFVLSVLPRGRICTSGAPPCRFLLKRRQTRRIERHHSNDWNRRSSVRGGLLVQTCWSGRWIFSHVTRPYVEHSNCTSRSVFRLRDCSVLYEQALGTSALSRASRAYFSLTVIKAKIVGYPHNVSETDGLNNQRVGLRRNVEL